MTEPHVVTLARRDRWRPTRAGLIGLWRYAEETFAFHHGRLLLRGPNGSGKSMALELLLPFLLDGDTSPHRLTSSGRSRGRLLDRLLAGSAEPSRTGFAWVEFERGDETFTVGARIRGSHTTGRTDVDLFTTSQRLDHDLHLLDASRTPLSRKALAEAIGDAGKVHDSAEEHRTAVRETLFAGFGPEKYASVITALLALRREKLSDRLDPAKLSEVLSDALPPVDDHDIAAVAEGFERLDRRRDELATLERDVGEIHRLAARQRAYARAVVLNSATRVRSAETVRDGVTRAERQAREQLSTAEDHAGEVARALTTRQARADEVDIEIAALKDSEAYKAGAGLADLGNHATQARARAEDAAAETRRRGEARQEAEAAAEHEAGQRAEAEGNLDLADRAVGDAADEVGAEAIISGARQEDDPDTAAGLVTAWTAAHRDRVAQVRAAIRTHGRAVDRRDTLSEQVAEDERELAQLDRLAADAADAEARSRDEYAGMVDQWVEQCTTVGAGRLRAQLSAPVREPGEVNAVVAGVRAHLAAEQATARQALATEQATVQAEQTELTRERDRWAAETTVEPARPEWRSDRDGRPGGPLWRLVDLAPGVAESTVDGLEAALTGAGLLDAWVSPTGDVQLPDGAADLLLTSRRLSRGPGGARTLAELVVPAPDSAVAAPVVTSVLSSIAVADTALDAEGRDVAMGLDGTFRLGSAVGRGPRRPALLLGAAARERRRQARLAEIDAALIEIDRRLTALARQLGLLEQRESAAEAELAAQPSPASVHEAVRLVADAQSRLLQAQAAIVRRRDARRGAEDAVRAALRELTTLASRHSLPTDSAGLDEVEHRVERLGDAAQTWARRRRELRTAIRAAEGAAAACERARGDAERAEATQRVAERSASELEQRFRTLESSVGADHRHVLDQLRSLDQERLATRDELGRLQQEDRDLAARVAELGRDVAAAAQRRAEADDQRDRTHGELRAALVALAPDAELTVDAPDTATAVLATARSLVAGHAAEDSSSGAIDLLADRVADQVHTAQTALRASVAIDRERTEEGWWLLRVTLNGLRRRIGEAHGSLTGQLEQGRTELAADEERLFEQTLAGSVRRALADRIRQANALVEAINVQLRAIKTAAAGVGVQLRWEVDPDQPTAVQSARTLLLRDPADLSDLERQALQDFVRARVDQAKVELEANAPWEARLRESLDYRAWHRFGLRIAHRDWDGYQPATASRLQRLSTGERSIALHLPMIAAVAAHYADEDGGPSGCPRLILLDELFAGVDVANRAQLFGAFTTWQLDAMFTSDHEWCQYRDLDGIAIHYLHPARGEEPVTSTRFTWDGARRVIDPVPA